ncbi:hypothetical protein BLL52_4314 [Rhodoferax antarcticus ANT.BR]|uniref:Lipoprotein n=1 Tax=Rhodoferax antarcticus ANT.BR TaxID=1111071 RepID=A0A1Q8Y996_9BURK|nr:hypothetical protein BLL52_4314 [Rhodoferax antarcticus ANT.BR]
MTVFPMHRMLLSLTLLATCCRSFRNTIATPNPLLFAVGFF